MARGREPVHGDNRSYGYILSSNYVEDALSLSRRIWRIYLLMTVYTLGRDNSWEERSNDRERERRVNVQGSLLRTEKRESFSIYDLTRCHEESSYPCCDVTEENLGNIVPAIKLL